MVVSQVFHSLNVTVLNFTTYLFSLLPFWVPLFPLRKNSSFCGSEKFGDIVVIPG